MKTTSLVLLCNFSYNSSNVSKSVGYWLVVSLWTKTSTKYPYYAFTNGEIIEKINVRSDMMALTQIEAFFFTLCSEQRKTNNKIHQKKTTKYWKLNWIDMFVDLEAKHIDFISKKLKFVSVGANQGNCPIVPQHS